MSPSCFPADFVNDTLEQLARHDATLHGLYTWSWLPTVAFSFFIIVGTIAAVLDSCSYQRPLPRMKKAAFAEALVRSQGCRLAARLVGDDGDLLDDTEMQKFIDDLVDAKFAGEVSYVEGIILARLEIRRY